MYVFYTLLSVFSISPFKNASNTLKIGYTSVFIPFDLVILIQGV